MAAKTCCRILSAGLCAASALRRATPETDCYSIYDGKPLLQFSVGAQAEFEEIMDRLVDFECQELAESTAQLLAICGATQTAKIEEMYGQKVEVLNKDAGAFYRNHSGVAQKFVAPPGAASDGTMNSYYTAWRDYATNIARVEDAVANSGGAATLDQIGTSVEGRGIMAVRIRGAGWSSGDARVILNFGLHAREWVASMSGVYAVEMATQKARDDSSWLAGMELVLVPLANPDGIIYSQTTSRMQRKNRARNSGSSCVGVDLNRNWDPDWSGRESTSSDPCSDVYYGPSAFSEPETQAIKNLIDEAPVAVHLDVHAYAEVILRPWGYTYDDHPQRSEIDKLGQAMKAGIETANGKRYTYGGNELLYPSSGICPDYSTWKWPGAFGYTYELSPSDSGGGGFAPPASEILPTAEDCLAGIYSAIDFLQNPPAPTPAPPPGTWTISGSGCVMDGNCVHSQNYPQNYGNSEQCNMELYGDIPISFEAFSTESNYDILTMGGTTYSGTSVPPSGTYSGSISWASDFSVVSSGWKLCRQGSSPGPVPTPAPTTPSPSPSPTTPAPTTPSPTPAPTTPAPPAPSPPSSGACYSACEFQSDCTAYPSICGGCSFC